MAKTKEELKVYNREKQALKRAKLKEEGIPTSSYKDTVKARKKAKEKGLLKFEVMNVDQETIELWKEWVSYTPSNSKAQNLKKLLKKARDNAPYWIV